MTTVVTRGAASAQALGYAARATAANYIEDVFSTYLYTGNRPTGQSIQNGIDLSAKGGLVWLKDRSAANSHGLFDSARGIANGLYSNQTAAQFSYASGITSFNSNGFTLGADSGGFINVSGNSYASWTFRKQAKFFDVVTYTGNGVNNRAISHNLGSTPGCVIVKRFNDTENWPVWHRSISSGGAGNLFLNLTLGLSGTKIVDADATTFTVINDTPVNASGSTYVAYLFAHDAGGFGASGTDNVITCGSFTTDGSGDATVTLGYEPQWILTKASSTTSNWFMIDNIRGMPVSNDEVNLLANTSSPETTTGMIVKPLPTGFSTNGNASSTTYIYIAIRRGPMRTPTSGTQVFQPVVYTGTNSNNRLVDTGILTDLAIVRQRNDSVLAGMVVGDRLRGSTYLLTGSTAAEDNDANSFMSPNATGNNSFSAMNGFGVGNDATSKLNVSTISNNQIVEAFKRAPGFFDVVCYTGTGSLRTVSHNLGSVPELLIVKRRDTVEDWNVYSATTGNAAYLRLNTTAAVGTAGADALWGSTTPTSSVFTVKTSGGTNASAGTYVAYLFASVAGVSKVGTYTGSGTTKQIDCGFTGGARFVLIKRTNSTGDWYVWDSARGIVAGNDPYLLLNSTAAEVTNTDYVDTYSAGFELSSTAPAAINANGGTFIFLAIA
jgi:hypothetical protein